MSAEMILVLMILSEALEKSIANVLCNVNILCYVNITGQRAVCGTRLVETPGYPMCEEESRSGGVIGTEPMLGG